MLVCVVMCWQVVYVSIGSKKLFCCVSVCVVMCRQVVYVSVGSRKIVSLCVGALHPFLRDFWTFTFWIFFGCPTADTQKL